MSNSTKFKITAICFLILIVIFALYIGYTARKEQKMMKETIADQQYTLELIVQRAEEVDLLLTDKKNGRRKDPFRCSDAKKYFKNLGVSIDCEKIEREVNGESK